MRRAIDARMQAIWYGESRWRWLLQPFAWLYGIAIRLRRAGFELGIFRSERVAAPVVVIGNIAVGGTGKTPLTLWLADRLAERGFQPGIVSRGFGGKAGPTPVVVTASSDPSVVGDEALMMARRSGFPIVVHPDRVAAANQVIDLGANIVLSDDGLQHYRLHRDVEIAVIDGTRRYGNRQLLPAGPLREPVSRLDNVHEVCMQIDADGEVAMERRAGDRQPLAFRLLASESTRLDNSVRKDLSAWAGCKVHAVAAIGNPERFFRMLEARRIDVIRHPLPDHANIVAEDLEFDDAFDVLMTEKDAVKCRNTDARHCWYVPASVVVEEADAKSFVDRIVAAAIQQ